MTEAHGRQLSEDILSGGRAGWPAILSSLNSLLETGEALSSGWNRRGGCWRRWKSRGSPYRNDLPPRSREPGNVDFPWDIPVQVSGSRAVPFCFGDSVGSDGMTDIRAAHYAIARILI